MALMHSKVRNSSSQGHTQLSEMQDLVIIDMRSSRVLANSNYRLCLDGLAQGACTKQVVGRGWLQVVFKDK